MPQSHYSHSEEYQTESSRGSDLSDIMEEDEEELYSEMQLEDGRRRNSHSALKVGSDMTETIGVIKAGFTLKSFTIFQKSWQKKTQINLFQSWS